MRGPLAVDRSRFPPDRVPGGFRGRLDAVPRAEWNRCQPGERADHVERHPQPAVEDEAPGFGSSSPIVVGSRNFVTCYSGYGIGETDSGRTASLKRHLVCINRETGGILWDAKGRRRARRKTISAATSPSTATPATRPPATASTCTSSSANRVSSPSIWRESGSGQSASAKIEQPTLGFRDGSLILSQRRADRERFGREQLDPRPRQSDRPPALEEPKPTCSSCATARRLSRPRRTGQPISWLRSRVKSGGSIPIAASSAGAVETKLTGNVCPQPRGRAATRFTSWRNSLLRQSGDPPAARETSPHRTLSGRAATAGTSRLRFSRESSSTGSTITALPGA